MIDITLPEFDFEISVRDWSISEGLQNCSLTSKKCYEMLDAIKWKKGGVYFLYQDDHLLYVGRSINIKDRLINHLTLGTATTKKHIQYVTHVKGFLVWDIADQEIYETYAIKTLKPQLNKAKTHRIRGNYGRVS